MTVSVAIVSTVRSVVVSVSVSITAVVVTGVTVVSPRWALTFFVPTLGPTIGLVMPHLVAIVALDVSLVVLVLCCRRKGLVWAIFVFVYCVAIVLV